MEQRELVSSEQDLAIVLRNLCQRGSLHNACLVSIIMVLEAFIRLNSYLRSHGHLIDSRKRTTGFL